MQTDQRLGTALKGAGLLLREFMGYYVAIDYSGDEEEVWVGRLCEPEVTGFYFLRSKLGDLTNPTVWFDLDDDEEHITVLRLEGQKILESRVQIGEDVAHGWNLGRPIALCKNKKAAVDAAKQYLTDRAP